MATGPSNELQYDFGICGECSYTTEQIVEDHPNGSPMLEATGKIIHADGKVFMVVIPHRPTCSLHTNQQECHA
jgi:hypothetical protein